MISDEFNTLNGLQILLVEDEPDTAELFAFVLKDAGAGVIVVTAISEALLALEYMKPSILISSINLPDGNGCSLIQKVRSREQEFGGFIPAIAVTGYLRDDEDILVIHAGFQTHLTKPIDPDKLVKVVASLSEKKELQ
ncbi:response regulator [Fischerella sp. JS2]|uniref:response regulator n=1 Tax=Fischerella sp. JS2 TaxID=2597771 RepID=UPI0028EBD563|nr:response regulator [Fischerella sp. JS2]